MVILTEEQAKKYVINTKESGLPFGPEDVVEVTKYGHLDVNCGRIEATVILNSGDKLIKLEALKRRWEFLKNVLSNEIDRYENWKCFTDDEESWSDGVAEGLSMALSEVERCIGSLFRKEADK